MFVTLHLSICCLNIMTKITLLMNYALSSLHFIIVDQDNKCIVLNGPLTTTIVILRSLTDLIYLLHMLLQVTYSHCSYCFSCTLLFLTIELKTCSLLYSSIHHYQCAMEVTIWMLMTHHQLEIQGYSC